MKVAAIDLGSNMAIANNLCPSGKINVLSRKFVGTREIRVWNTMLWFREEVWPFFADLRKIGQELDAVIYELPFARGQHATRSLWGLAGLIEATATEAGYPVLDRDPQTIKKFATGNSRASKEEMIAAAQAHGYLGENEHEADAYWLCLYAQETLRSKGVK